MNEFCMSLLPLYIFFLDLSNVQEVSQDNGNTIIIGSSFGNDTTSIILHFNGSTPMSPISVSDSMLTFKFPQTHQIQHITNCSI
ncbi:hypothetical protein PPL_04824 [Heterostelium album PN500]|uniref:IPT/TIG domain-containing protein n=1 Tax=Heterostelium pallidum (strain ATCC 26659 / Pp 5 / PN500) TaxID=670386 RepID=D3B8N1_HETP5|nr:hypothetical protein PPL_04824 [Heterostelium album PN500]EFA82399.1 hypothetical protein PPL_04824 [Heterostelium album PN500]|eukprot:XP_020434516.1 hypothetical protein PPL_04824 [Heterostelium album PN500]